MKRTIIISLLGTLVINAALAAAQPERRIQSLAGMCRSVVTQDPNFIQEVLPALHVPDTFAGNEKGILPAMRINNALLNRIPMQRVLQGHRRVVTSVAFSPDGTTLASASDDHTVRLWDATTLLRQEEGYEGQAGACLHILQGHTCLVSSVSFSPDGTILASASWDNTLRLWDAQSGACRHTLQGHTDWIISVAFSPDGTTLASASNDETVRIWNMQSGACLRTLQGHTGRVRTVAFSPDGTTLASGSSDDTVRLWNTQSGACLRTLQGHTHWINQVAFSPDGTTLASASRDRTVRLWNAQSGACRHTLQGHTGSVNSIAFSPDGTTLASASWDNTLRLWDAQSGACRHILQGHTDWIISVAFSPDGTTLASASNDETVRIWNTQSGACLRTLQGHTGRVRTVAFSPDGTTLASGSSDDTVRLWTDYQKDLGTITNFDEQRLLLTAAEDWLAGRPHQVSANDPIYLRLIERFPFLSNPELFTVIQPNEYAGMPTCSSSGNTPASSSEHTEQPTVETPANNAAPIIEAQQLAAPAPAPTFWQEHRTPIVATGLTAAACALGAYLWNRYRSQ